MAMRSLVALLLVACSEPSRFEMPRELARLQAVYEGGLAGETFFDPDDLVLAPSGVYFRRKRVSTYGDMTHERATLLVGAAQVDDAPHSIVVFPEARPEALAMILRSASLVGWNDVRIGELRDKHIAERCVASFATRPADPARLDLSVLAAPKRLWVGVSGIFEFEEFPDLPDGTPDLEKVDVAIRLRKASAHFAARDDAQLGFAGDTSLALHLGVLDAVCDSFRTIAVLQPDELSAKPF